MQPDPGMFSGTLSQAMESIYYLIGIPSLSPTAIMLHQIPFFLWTCLSHKLLQAPMASLAQWSDVPSA